MILAATIALVLAAIPAVLFGVNLLLYRRTPGAAPSNPPASLSVLIPARNEERNIRSTLEAALASRDVQIEVVVLDDHSTDQTAAIVSAFAARDSRVRLESAPPLPPGWCGKQHACHRLAGLARHPWLVFIDADVRLAPDALARMAQFMQARPHVALASGVPRQELATFSERLLLPLIHFILLGFLPMPLMRRTKLPGFSAGCGQLFIAPREAYFAAGGHAAIRATLHDGVKLPRAFRRAGLATDLFDATDLATCRMYHTNRETWRGLGKNATEGLAAPGTILPMTALLLGGQALPFALLACAPWLSPGALAVTIAAAILALAPRLVAMRRFRQPPDSALLHPFGVLALLAIQWLALAAKLAGQPMQWKGRAYAPGPASAKPATARAASLALGLGLMALTLHAGAPPAGSPSRPLKDSLPSFELRDQFDATHRFSFPRSNILVLTIADKQGDAQVDGWVRPLMERFGTHIALVGIADVRGVPALWRGTVRERFRQHRTHPVMLDWDGQVIGALRVERHRANVYLFTRQGTVLRHMSGPAEDPMFAEFCTAVEQALSPAKP